MMHMILAVNCRKSVIECAIMIKAAGKLRMEDRRMKKRKESSVYSGNDHCDVTAWLLFLWYCKAVPQQRTMTKEIKLGLDLAGGVSITYQVKGDETPSAEDMKDTVYKLQKRVETYSTEAEVYQVGDNRISVEIPGVSDANSILEELGTPGTLEFKTHRGRDIHDR